MKKYLLPYKKKKKLIYIHKIHSQTRPQMMIMKKNGHLLSKKIFFITFLTKQKNPFKAYRTK